MLPVSGSMSTHATAPSAVWRPPSSGHHVPQVALTSSAPTTSDDTVEFPVLADPPRLVAAVAAERAIVTPFRSRAADLVALFETAEAQTPWWHRERARALRRDANAQTVAAITGAY